MKLHYTKAELTEIKRKLKLRWVTSWKGTTLQVGSYHSHFLVRGFLSKRNGETRYKLEACRSDLRISGRDDSLIGTFDTSDAAMAFAEWLLPAVDEQEETALALRKEKRRIEREKQEAEDVARAAKYHEAEALISLLAAQGITATHCPFNGGLVQLTPAELRKLMEAH